MNALLREKYVCFSKQEVLLWIVHMYQICFPHFPWISKQCFVFPDSYRDVWVCFTPLCEMRRLKTHTSVKTHISSSLRFSHTNTEWHNNLNLTLNLLQKAAHLRHQYSIQSNVIYFTDAVHGYGEISYVYCKY